MELKSQSAGFKMLGLLGGHWHLEVTMSDARPTPSFSLECLRSQLGAEESILE